MNIIEAWKTAKDTQEVHRQNGKNCRVFHDGPNMRAILEGLSYVDLTADDWEVALERKSVQGEIDPLSSVPCKHQHVIFDVPVPTNATVTATWEE